MKKCICKKLLSSRGESLAETLIAVLVIAVAMTLLAGMITATSSMVKKSENKMNEYYTESVKLESFSETTSSTVSIEVVKQSGETFPKISMSDINVKYAQNAVFSTHPVIAYQKTA